ncbi:MAG: SDR family oxidoreductase [Saccharospirillaceae bacterium]|nr:SDR family oxidoreductase [Pseudomonadales bacterium]NRB80048.1 SDR family oxidoreductase [Saccharospirillaceae bacterium]
MKIIITGANRGIGLSLTNLYLKQGHQVYAICRSDNNLLSLNNDNLEIINNCDVCDEQNIQKIADYFSDIKIDLLINNAGILRDETLGALNVKSINDQFQTNALAPLLVTQSLLDSMIDQTTLSKVVFITSRMGSITDNTSGGRYGYRMSKVALNIAAKSMSVDLKANNVAVAIIHPGLVGTDMIGGQGNLTPDEAAQKINKRIEGLTLDNTGTFWYSNGDVLPW